MKKLTSDQINRIKELYGQDYTLKAIAEEVGCSVSAAWYHSQNPEHILKYRRAMTYCRKLWKDEPDLFRKHAPRYMEFYAKQGMAE